VARWGRDLRAVVWVLGALTLAIGLTATQAGAVGDQSLDQVILVNPLPGWQHLSAAVLSSASERLSSIEQSVIGPMGGRDAVAAEGWSDPSWSASITVFLVALAGRSGSLFQSSVDSQLIVGANAAALNACASAVGRSPDFNTPVLGVPNSHLAECSSPNTGHTLLVAAWPRANVLAMVVASGVGSKGFTLAPTVSSLVAGQYGEMSAGDTVVPEPPSVATPRAPVSTGGHVALIVLGITLALIVGLVAGLCLAHIRRRRSPSLMAASGVEARGHAFIPGYPADTSSLGNPPAGWYPDPSVPDRRRFWTGQRWGPALDAPVRGPTWPEGSDGSE
jgi:hypothetical protein